jgi:hypothetical protein
MLEGEGTRTEDTEETEGTENPGKGWCIGESLNVAAHRHEVLLDRSGEWSATLNGYAK